MKNRASIAPIIASPAAPRPTSSTTPWTERLMLRLMGIPTDEEVAERLRNYRGFIARLTPEQIAAMDATDEFEVLGSPNGPRRTF
jgi:hypothetical protein